MTREAVADLGLAEGSAVTVLVKSAEVTSRSTDTGLTPTTGSRRGGRPCAHPIGARRGDGVTFAWLAPLPTRRLIGSGSARAAFDRVPGHVDVQLGVAGVLVGVVEAVRGKGE